MVWQDPPYNVDYANSAKDKLRGTNRPILNDNLGDGFQRLPPGGAHADAGVL